MSLSLGPALRFGRHYDTLFPSPAEAGWGPDTDELPQLPKYTSRPHLQAAEKLVASHSSLALGGESPVHFVGSHLGKGRRQV